VDANQRAGSNGADAAPTTGRLLVVSNRLPLTLRRSGDEWRSESSAGGLATALEPVLRRTDGLWIGWPGDGDPAAPGRREALVRWQAKGYRTVDIPASVAQRFYQGYANRTLWPLFHQFPSQLEFEASGWDAYVDANRRFHDAVLHWLRPGDLVWVHDYHLMLLPQMLRESAPDAAIGFFLHIPFPSSDVFRVLPRRDELLRGLLGADCLAFQTHGDLQHFRASVLRVLGIGSRMDRLEADGRFVRLDALPIGISPGEFTGPLESSPAVRDELLDLRRRFESQRILLAVDRLDYTKGIPERLRAFRILLQRSPEFRGRVVLVQIAVPSREAVPRYRELRHEVNRIVGEINGDFGTPGWTPVVYIRRAVSRIDLIALYAAADVGWVTPLRDGMNLVAKEYVACHKGRDGVLLLSEFAGAAAEMGEAILVNPYDEERTAASLERVLAMDPEEQRERMSALYRRIVRNDAHAWSERFLASLNQSTSSRCTGQSGEPLPLPVREAREAFLAARQRALFLDFDGTLVPYANRPREVVPPPSLLALLARLSSAPENRVAIVSDRPRAELEPWFAGLHDLWLIAEHGAVLKPPGGNGWRALHPTLDVEWKARVTPVLEHFADRTPGSFIEETEYSLVWHYRMSDPEFGDWLANELVANLEEMLAECELRAVRGQRCVEVKLAWANKSEAVAFVEDGETRPDFRLAMGDDRTDDELFERLPPDSWTVHVGAGPSRARYRLPSPAAAVQFLEMLCAQGPTHRPSST
jgi:trehalose 6-phosphate synthase/phosphatase